MVDVERHWPWITLVAAVVANVLSGGVVRSYGIIYMDFRDRLETSSVETIVLAALALGIAGLIAPLAEGLSKKLGCFLVTLFGSIEMCLGFIISSFLSNVYWHYITLGALVGCGSGLVQIASIVAVLNVFNDKPALVYALLSLSFPLGTFLFGFITRGLLDRYSYFGTFLILAAIVANCIICGLLYRPYRVKNSMKKKKNPPHKSSTYERMTSPVDDVEDIGEGGGGSSTTTDAEDVDVRETESPVDDETSMIHKPGMVHYNSVIGPTEEIIISADTDVIRFSDYVVDDEVYVSSEDEEVTDPRDDKGDVKVTENPVMEQSMQALPRHEESSTEEQKPVNEVTEEPPPSLIQSISDPRSLCNWRFIVLILAVLLYSMAFGVPLVCYPDLSREHDITDWRAVWTLTVIGVLSSFSVVVSEFSLQRVVADYPRTIVVLIAGSTLVGGVIVALAHYYSTFEKLLLSAILFGLFSAPCRSLGVSTYVIRETTLANDVMPFFVWGNLVSGVGFLISLPVAGMLHDMTGDYSWSFGFAGICFVVSAILSTFIVCHRRGHVRLID